MFLFSTSVHNFFNENSLFVSYSFMVGFVIVGLMLHASWC
jgi:hypothetical protein